MGKREWGRKFEVKIYEEKKERECARKIARENK